MSEAVGSTDIDEYVRETITRRTHSGLGDTAHTEQSVDTGNTTAPKELDLPSSFTVADEPEKRDYNRSGHGLVELQHLRRIDLAQQHAKFLLEQSLAS